MFFENIAKYYGNDWATPPFRLCLTNTNVSDRDYNELKILKLADPLFKLQSHVTFNMEYLIWIVDQFLQPAFSDSPMLLNLSNYKSLSIFKNRTVKLRTSKNKILILGMKEMVFEKIGINLLS